MALNGVAVSILPPKTPFTRTTLASRAYVGVYSIKIVLVLKAKNHFS
jgi:hypothetical protein